MTDPDAADDPTVDRRSIRRLWPWLRPHRRALALAAALSLVSAAASLAQPLLVRAVLERVQAGAALAGAVTALVAVVVVGALLDGGQRYLLQRTAEGVVLTTRRRLVATLLRLPVPEFDRRPGGDLLSRVGADTTLLRAVVTGGLVELAAGLLVAVGAIVLMALLDLLLLAVTLTAVAVGMVTVVVVARRVRTLTEQAQAAVGVMTSAVDRALGAVRTIKASRAEDREAAAVDASARQAFDAGVRVARLEALIAPMASVAAQGAFLAVLGVGGAGVATGRIGVGDLVAFVLYLFLLIQPLAQALRAWTTLQSGLGALARIEEVEALPREPAEPAEPTGARCVARVAERAAAGAPPPALTFAGVDFAYPDGTRVLHGVDLEVPRGARVALVGPSGAGKSTLLALAERFYEPTAGAVLLDGIDLRDLPLDHVRARLGYVEQDAPVLAGTIGDNLRLTAPDASDQDLLDVLGLVNLRGLVDRTPAGLATPVGDDGVLLSGGERQRLAIARTLLAAPPVLLFDEPTSNLDARNEAALAAAIATVAADRTTLMVAHRLSTVVGADRIAVLDDGRVVAQGTHAELLDHSPLYRELASHQLLTAGPSER